MNWTREDQTTITVVVSGGMVPGTFLFDESLQRKERKILIATFGSRLARMVTLSSEGHKISPVHQKLVTRAGPRQPSSSSAPPCRSRTMNSRHSR